MADRNPKELVLDAMAAVLKPRGYRRRGGVFSRPSGDAIHLIGLQSSSSSTAATAKVTVNLAMWFPSLEDADSKPGIANAHWRERIGFLVDERTDRWWTISSPVDAEQAGAEIVDVLEQTALPKLDTLSTTPAMIALWQSGRSPGLTEFQRTRYLAALLAGDS